MINSNVEIMPAYNAEKTIEKAIKGIISQTHKQWSLIISDDGSTDSTKEIVEKYRQLDTRITRFSTLINRGVSAARNFGLGFVCPDSAYIAYCDADDVWKPDHLETCLPFLRLGADIVYSTPEFIDEEGNEVQPNFTTFNNFNIDNLRRGNFIWISTVVHKREFSGEFDSNLDSLEDYDLWIRAAKQGMKFKQFNKKTVTYLVKNTGMAQKGVEVRKKLQIKHLDFISPLKLHLGCGTEYLDDYINCDLYADKVDLRADVAKIDLPDNSVDEIKAYHIIEHFDFMQGQDVIKEWYRVLKPGGRIHLETPDLLNTCKHFVNGSEQDRITLYGHFFAWPWLPGQTHKFLFTESQMGWLLSQTGIKHIQRLAPDSIYARSGVPAELLLNMEGYK